MIPDRLSARSAGPAPHPRVHAHPGPARRQGRPGHHCGTGL